MFGNDKNFKQARDILNKMFAGKIRYRIIHLKEAMNTKKEMYHYYKCDL